jgi:hypothetical protein
VLVGHGAAGKMTLMQRLIRNTFDHVWIGGIDVQASALRRMQLRRSASIHAHPSNLLQREMRSFLLCAQFSHDSTTKSLGRSRRISAASIYTQASSPACPS